MIGIAILTVGIFAHVAKSSISLGTCSLSCNEEDDRMQHLLGGNNGKTPVGFPGKAGPEGRIGPRGPPGQKGDAGVCDCSNYQKISGDVGNLKALGEVLRRKNFINDCKKAKKIVKTSGVTIIFPVEPTTNGIHVYCNQDIDGGGWIVIQRRVGGPVNFHRGWEDYKRGFGNKEGDFWLGLEDIYLLTKNESYELRVDLEDHSGNKAYAKYNSFRLGGADENYRLYVSEYSGNAGDGLGPHNGKPFSTYDRDNDDASYNCAVSYKGAWWYHRCHSSNLNGLYGGSTRSAQAVAWYQWKKTQESLKITEMMIRRVAE